MEAYIKARFFNAGIDIKDEAVQDLCTVGRASLHSIGGLVDCLIEMAVRPRTEMIYRMGIRPLKGARP